MNGLISSSIGGVVTPHHHHLPFAPAATLGSNKPFPSNRFRPSAQSRNEVAARLVIIVHRKTSVSHQSWTSECPSKPPTDDPCSLIVSGIRGLRSEGPHDRVAAYESVSYSLSQIALDHFADEQGMERLPVQATTLSFTCPIFLRLTDLISLSLDAPAEFPPSFMDQFVKLLCAQVLHSRCLFGDQRHPHRGGLAPWQKRRAIELLSSQANVTLPVVARECTLSVSHFARSFKTTFGMPVHRWVIQQRVEKAKERLVSSTDSLLQVAFDAGFCDQASFNRTFAKAVGTSPGRWRRSYKV